MPSKEVESGRGAAGASFASVEIGELTRCGSFFSLLSSGDTFEAIGGATGESALSIAVSFPIAAGTCGGNDGVLLAPSPWLGFPKLCPVVWVLFLVDGPESLEEDTPEIGVEKLEEVKGEA